MYPLPIQKRHQTVRFTYYVALPIFCLLWLIPLLAVIATSVRPMGDLNGGNYWGLPSSFDLVKNYSEIFTNGPLGLYMLNSLKVTIPTVIGTIILSSLAGFALANYEFRLNKWVFMFFVAGNFVPFQILMIPVRDFTLKIGLYDTSLGLIFFHIAFQTGFSTLFMRNFIRELPRELVESARVEGLSEWKIFRYIILPLVRPAVASLALLEFTFVWNDFFWSLVLTQSKYTQPVTAGILALNGQYSSAYNLMSAAALCAALPPIIAFFLLQKHFIAGLTLGGGRE
ncbi:MAG: carbohydrate ABC transporter permease [Candidatus Symbiobacter sp.]|nr:carbohydrate ABC transporter permease [Candidatus Symbiobacter sp.]